VTKGAGRMERELQTEVRESLSLLLWTAVSTGFVLGLGLLAASVLG
jgi:hypothetical protein